MVIFKHILFSSLTLSLLIGCCYQGITNDYNKIRGIKPPNYLINNDIYNIIDTTAVYVEYASEIGGVYYEFKKNQTHFLKFYSDNKIGSFILHSNIIRNEDLNPQKARAGYIHINKHDYHISFFTYNQCKKVKVKGKLYIKKDTLEIEYLNESIKRDKSYFVKNNIDNDSLQLFTPDW